MAIHTQSVHRYVCIYRYSSQRRDAGRTKVIGAAVNAACQGNLSACHFGHACHRFGGPGIEKSGRVHSCLSLQQCHATQLLQCHCSQTFHKDFYCSQNTSRGRISFTPASEVRPSDVPFSPHGTHNCDSTPTLRKIPETLRLRCVRSQKSDGPAHLPTAGLW